MKTLCAFPWTRPCAAVGATLALTAVLLGAPPIKAHADPTSPDSVVGTATTEGPSEEQTTVPDQPIGDDQDEAAPVESADESSTETSPEDLGEGVAEDLSDTPAPEFDEADSLNEDAAFLPGIYPAQPAKKGMQRLAGTDRYATAAAVAARVANATDQVDTVFIASGQSYADGLTISALAAYSGSPMLLVQPTALPAVTKARITALNPKHIVIAGGQGAISDPVLNSLGKALPDAQIERIAGQDRYATAALIAERFPTGSSAFLATGQNFPDALAAAAAASKLGGPVLLTPGFRSDSATRESLRNLQPESVYLVGGQWSNSDINSVQSAAGVASAKKLTGADRYETSAAVAKQFWGATAETVVYATGRTFADAMVGASAARAFDAPILLTNGGCRTQAVAKVAANQSSMILLGGTAAVSDYAYTNTCITASKFQATPSFKNGTYSFNIAWAGQQTNYWCGPASAYMVLKRLGFSKSVQGHNLTQANLASNTYLETERNGRTLWPGNYMGQGIQRWTGRALYSQESSPNTTTLRNRIVNSFLKTGRPIMVHQTITPDLPIINNQRSRDTTHVLVVNSYNPQTDTVTLLDPAAGVVWPNAARSFTIKVGDLTKYLSALGLYY